MSTMTQRLPQPADSAGPDAPFVVMSEIAVSAGGEKALEAAFGDRLGEVDGWPGFLDLQVWRDEREGGGYLMVSWWETKEHFSAYMRSEAHRRSHARIPDGPDGPRPAGVRLLRVVAR
ncbi:MAG: antibiotic biosynthesis monooxygenase [Egibacteraceae bacterium]